MPSIKDRRDLLPWIKEREREAAGDGIAALSPAALASINAAIQFRDWASLARLSFLYGACHGVASVCLLDACAVINATKGRGYAGGDDFLANFYRVAEREGIDAQRAIAVYLWKHFDWLTTYQRTGTAHGDEGLASRLSDLILYAALGQAVKDREAETRVQFTRSEYSDPLPMLRLLEPETEVLT